MSTDNPNPPKQRLTELQLRFVAEMTVEPIPARAARRAGYSLKVAREMASVNMAKPHVLEAIREARAELLARTHITPQRVIEELSYIAFADPRDVDVDQHGNLTCDGPDQARAVKGVDLQFHPPPDGLSARELKTFKPIVKHKKVIHHNKDQALLLFLRHLGLISADMPPLDVLLNRLPPKVATTLRKMLAQPVPTQPEQHPTIPTIPDPPRVSG